MTKTHLMTSAQAAALVSDAIGVPISARRVNGWAKAGSGSFPPLALAVNGSLIRHSREAVEAWLAERFPDNSKNAKRNPDVRLERVIRRGRPRS